MTYKLTNINLELITSPIILIMPTNADDGDKRQNIFRDGLELAEKTFAHKYEINTVRARNDGANGGMIEIGLSIPEVERPHVKDETTGETGETGETADVSFF